MFDPLRVVSSFGDHRVIAINTPRRAFGVPPGGPFDRLAAALAKALVGLPNDAPSMEITLGPVVFEAKERLSVAVVGGPDGVFTLVKGQRLEVQPINARAYVAVAPESLSPLGERRVQRGMRSGAPQVDGGEGSRLLADPPRLGREPIRVIPGPQANLLDLDAFLGGTYTVGNASNRVGVRLEGPILPHGVSLPSEPAISGAIQIPPKGQPIVLGPDGPTIGGYPKIAVVIDADLDRLARARPGETLRFLRTSVEEARHTTAMAKAERVRRADEIRIALLDG